MNPIGSSHWEWPVSIPCPTALLWSPWIAYKQNTSGFFQGQGLCLVIVYHFLWENLYYYLSYSSKFLSRSMRNDVHSQSHLIWLDESWVLCQCLVYGCHLSQLAGVRTENHAHQVTARCTAKPKSQLYSVWLPVEGPAMTFWELMKCTFLIPVEFTEYLKPSHQHFQNMDTALK